MTQIEEYNITSYNSVFKTIKVAIDDNLVFAGMSMRNNSRYAYYDLMYDNEREENNLTLSYRNYHDENVLYIADFHKEDINNEDKCHKIYDILVEIIINDIKEKNNARDDKTNSLCK